MIWPEGGERRLREIVESRANLIFDAEGVLCSDIDSPEAAPGAAELLAELRSMGKRTFVLTNVTRKSRAEVIEALDALGLGFRPEEVMTAGYLAALYVKSRKPGARCFAISEGGLIEDLISLGLRPVSNRPVDFVVIGSNRKLSYWELNFAMELAIEGVEVVCAGASPIFRGEFMGRRGVFMGEEAFAEAIRHVVGCGITYVGKPHRLIFELAFGQWGVGAGDSAMVGDGLRSDVGGARAVGMPAILITKGEEFRFEELPKEWVPDVAVGSLAEMLEGLRSARS